MELQVAGLTDVGLKRVINQDSFIIDSDLGLFVVADGMGGHQGGEVASSLAVQTIRDVVSQAHGLDQPPSPKMLMIQAYQAANRRIFELSGVQSDLKGMGTTMVTVLYRDGSFYVGNVGDSRAYLIRNGLAWLLTEDHSLINEQMRYGRLTPQEMNSLPSRNIITRSVGFEADVNCDVIERVCEVGETLLLCSDGLSSLVPDAKVAELGSHDSLDVAAHMLVEEAKKNGGDDNVTVVLLRAISNN